MELSSKGSSDYLDIRFEFTKSCTYHIYYIFVLFRHLIPNPTDPDEFWQKIGRDPGSRQILRKLKAGQIGLLFVQTKVRFQVVSRIRLNRQSTCRTDGHETRLGPVLQIQNCHFWVLCPHEN